MPIRDSMEFETRGFQHHKGTVGIFQNKWLSLIVGLVLASILIAFLLWCRAEFIANYSSIDALRPASIHIFG